MDLVVAHRRFAEVTERHVGSMLARLIDDVFGT